jgi:hypothetical protein
MPSSNLERTLIGAQLSGERAITAGTIVLPTIIIKYRGKPVEERASYGGQTYERACAVAIDSANGPSPNRDRLVTPDTETPNTDCEKGSRVCKKGWFYRNWRWTSALGYCDFGLKFPRLWGFVVSMPRNMPNTSSDSRDCFGPNMEPSAKTTRSKVIV